MEVNGNIIKGIFTYNSDVKYTEEDFVVEDDKLYVCTEASIGNLPSESPDQFKPYLGAATTSKISDSSTSFVSSLALGEYLSGSCNMKGIIPNDVNQSRELYFRDFFGNESGLSLGDKYLDPLDNLITSDINQIVVNVDKSVVESFVGACTLNPILRQYSYETSTTSTRVQELVKVDSGDLYFRTSTKYGTLDNGEPWSAPTSWKNVSVNGNTREVISQIKAYYHQKCHDLEIYKAKMAGSFRYKKIDMSGSNYSSEASFSVKELYAGSTMITVTLRENEREMPSVYSATFDISDLHNNEPITYKITDEVSIDFELVDHTDVVIRPISGYLVVDVYMRVPPSYDPYIDYKDTAVSIPVKNLYGDGITLDTSDLPSGTRPLSYIKVEIKNHTSFIFPANMDCIYLITDGDNITVTHQGQTGQNDFYQLQGPILGEITADDVTAFYVNI